MKYIRTKEGRIFNLIAYKEDCEINGAIRYTSKLNGGYFFIQKDNILKQADTIEELCDEFVCWTLSGRVVYMDIVQIELNLQYFTYKSIYGAIWTDKGLIYVAKMNEKGELELL